MPSDSRTKYPRANYTSQPVTRRLHIPLNQPQTPEQNKHYSSPIDRTKVFMHATIILMQFTQKTEELVNFFIKREIQPENV